MLPKTFETTKVPLGHFWGGFKLTKQATKPFEIILTYLETFRHWVPLFLAEMRLTDH